jgi:hypothetical protein
MARLTGALQDGSHVLAKRDLAWRRQLVGIRSKRRGLRHACKRYNEKDRKAYAHGALLPSDDFHGTFRQPVGDEYTPVAQSQARRSRVSVREQGAASRHDAQFQPELVYVDVESGHTVRVVFTPSAVKWLDGELVHIEVEK